MTPDTAVSHYRQADSTREAVLLCLFCVKISLHSPVRPQRHGLTALMAQKGSLRVRHIPELVVDKCSVLWQRGTVIPEPSPGRDRLNQGEQKLHRDENKSRQICFAPG